MPIFKKLKQICSVLLRAVLLLIVASPAYALSSSVVISQVYGGGGNSGAIYNSDFIEIFNLSSSSVNLTGWSVQYAPANGVNGTNWTSIALTGSLAAGQYYLIRLGNGGATGVALPTPDASLLTLNINANSGKVALLNTTTLLNVQNPVGLAQTIDFVGYGNNANASETAQAPSPSNSTAILRLQLGCTETDNNSTDFAAGAPQPKNTSSPLRVCGPLINFQKSVTVLCDPFNGVTNPKNIPGSVVQYAVTATNAGSAPLSLVQTSDLLSSLLAFDGNLINGLGGAAGCNSTTGTPTSATGRGFSLDITGDTRGASYPKYLTTTNADADGASYNAGNISIDYSLAMPVESGYTAGELRPGESAVVKFNAVVQ